MSKTTLERREVPKGTEVRDYIKSVAQKFGQANGEEGQQLLSVKEDKKHHNNGTFVCLKMRKLSK